MNIDTTKILEQMKAGAIDAAQSLAEGFVEEAEKDAGEFIDLTAPKIRGYLAALRSKNIDEDDFKRLMLALISVTEMKALTLAGLAAQKIKEIEAAIVKSLGDIAGGALKSIA